MGWVSGFTTAMYIGVEYITFLPSMVYLCGSEEGTLQTLGHIIGKLLAAKLSHSTITCFRFIHHATLSISRSGYAEIAPATAAATARRNIQPLNR